MIAHRGSELQGGKKNKCGFIKASFGLQPVILKQLK